MTKEKVPRRLRRFYREDYNETNTYPKNNYSYDPYSNTNYNQPLKTTKIPTMEYEDIDEKNLKEIEKIEQKNLEEKLAILEIEKFKKEKKRPPNKEEAEHLASSLYEQFKNNPTDPNSEEMPERMSPRERYKNRHKRNRKIEENEEQEFSSQGLEEYQNPNTDIKSMFEESNNKKNNHEDDFDLGLDFDDSNLGGDSELEELEDFSIGKKKKKKQD